MYKVEAQNLHYLKPRDPALAALFVEMTRRGTILDATVWIYSADTASSTTLSPLPPGSCDDAVGGPARRSAGSTLC